ncbi:MAG: hypothetical protein AAF730_12095 [Bacteroidota bacterium]
MEWVFIHYILMYPNTRTPGILRKLDAVRDTKQVCILKTPREVEQFMGGLNGQAAT